MDVANNQGCRSPGRRNICSDMRGNKIKSMVPQPLAESETLEEWARQQVEMASQVVANDDVPWCLDAQEPGQRLQRIGGLDISFLEPPAAAAAVATHAAEAEAASGERGGGGGGSGGGGGGAMGTGGGGSDVEEREREDGGGQEEAGAPPAAASGPGVAALVVLRYPVHNRCPLSLRLFFFSFFSFSFLSPRRTCR
ncbi:hypothetical protein Agub_g5305 [Astrephomene gubernaculifera]|uniref:Uncharacterized protein n=1 Tax=Astrephomene gubernaculifera TaxID=47775 RepID=A0AAD3DN37_9CHLO|nr:hypothetical protein Agub_g5305 [Astrephomene gubernaculifera]